MTSLNDSSHVNPAFESSEDEIQKDSENNKKNHQQKLNGEPAQMVEDISCVKKDKILTIESEDALQKDEEEIEDYSLLSFLPKSYYNKINDFRENISKEHDIKELTNSAGMLVLGFAFLAYFIAVLAINSEIQKTNYWCSGDGLLMILVLIAVLGAIHFTILKPRLKDMAKDKIKFISEKMDKAFEQRRVKLSVIGVVLVAVAVFLLVDTAGDRQRLTSIFGIVCILLFGFLFSAAPRKIRWRHVIWGLALQFLMGLMILRWKTGREVFGCIGDKVHTFLKFTDDGAMFVFGSLVTGNLTIIVPELEDKVKLPTVFAFTVLPVVLFFSFCIQILYYYGIMQWIVIKLGWFLQVTIGTTACESVNASANIFLGQSEAPLLIKPYLSSMTKSELHAVLTGGFATVAGSVLAAFISFGVDSTHLLSASIMSAPAALAYSKLFYPETKPSKTSAKDIKMVKGEEANVLHAALVGVTNAIPLVANIAANLIAFISFLALFNSVFNWSCQLVNIDDGVCKLDNIFGYIFMPLAYVMGVEWEQCYYVGELIGLKTIVNEFVAYLRLVDMKNKNLLSYRAEIISTYALCGFSNISSMGIQLGAMSAMAPERQADLSKLVVRAMIAGSCACFLTACVAGILLEDPSIAEIYVNGTST